MGIAESLAYAKLTKVGKRQYDLDKAIAKRDNGGVYAPVRDKLTAEGATYYQSM